jgi:hypothetical protein
VLIIQQHDRRSHYRADVSCYNFLAAVPKPDHAHSCTHHASTNHACADTSRNDSSATDSSFRRVVQSNSERVLRT